jgi:hypothetical protein
MITPAGIIPQQFQIYNSKPKKGLKKQSAVLPAGRTRRRGAGFPPAGPLGNLAGALPFLKRLNRESPAAGALVSASFFCYN